MIAVRTETEADYLTAYRIENEFSFPSCHVIFVLIDFLYHILNLGLLLLPSTTTIVKVERGERNYETKLKL